MQNTLTRRHALALLATLALPLTARAAEDLIELEWDDLIPHDGNALEQAAEDLGVIVHDQISTMPDQPDFAPTTDEYNGKMVKIPGFVVPLEYLSTGVTTFILVPYVGACIHVPPPPANQLVLVTTEEPQEFSGLFEPVWVTGVFGTAATATDLADIGYALSAEKVEPYDG
ncbi:DUF3299 domain-containing protein [Tropicimonas sp. TH_r6]|uniref:DUF3299 domain-containing protein n=1 Tax=Tropicimonas sp. TH_r6 TaxID=3082085 RepID=UPI002955276C|nr:DUF3299 domain-containing protein [Tropicimonas sp. TH_r6]